MPSSTYNSLIREKENLFCENVRRKHERYECIFYIFTTNDSRATLRITHILKKINISDV